MSSHGPGAPPTGRALAALSLAALGVVYGDIGTSPLYALKECFLGRHSIEPTPANVLGVMSLVFWAMNFVVSFKYISHVMRADNRGEGGILALLALVRGKRTGERNPRRKLMIALGIVGAALLYGDGVITPAISVLGAVEGLAVAAPAVERYVPWIAAVILVVLFLFQRRGTAGVGMVFGPVMLVWFACISVLGVRGILMEPAVLRAIDPLVGLDLFLREKLHGFLILGSVVLVITGGEALYADMGHFGRRPIRLAWFCVALPALTLNYFGQSALLLRHPDMETNPFFELVPGWALYPMVVIATSAAIVASQALISGAFSLTQQAVQLGLSPRVRIIHTSTTEAGQIYIPEVNQLLAVACIGLVLGFGSTDNLAAAYGIAVTGTMVITTLLFHRVMLDLWRWPAWRAWLLTFLFLVVDLAFLGANAIKIEEGGWFPLVVAALLFLLMTTWRRGRQRLQAIMRETALPLDLFVQDMARRKPPRVPGVAVFMTPITNGAPPVLLHHLKHNKMLHERVILLSVLAEEVPYVEAEDRVSCEALGEDFYQVIGRYGFMEQPDVPALLALVAGDAATGEASKTGPMKPHDISFFLGRETLIPTASAQVERLEMSMWRKKLFVLLNRNAQAASNFFALPPNRVVELGAQIQF